MAHTATNSRNFTRILGVFVLLVTMPVAAADLTGIKQSGLVGERPDGYVGFVQQNVTEDVRALVQEVNRKRRAQYQRIANTNNIALAEVEVLAGKKAIGKTQTGNYFMTPNQQWQQK